MAGQAFKALPREEIDRHYASIEVLPVDIHEPRAGAELTLLGVQVVLHYNYSWLTHLVDPERSDLRSLGISAPLTAQDDAGLFLDERWVESAAAVVDRELSLPDTPELRLAGLLDAGDGWLDLVYVARLRRPGALSRGRIQGIAFSGMGELQTAPERLGPTSRPLIDSLQSL